MHSDHMKVIENYPAPKSKNEIQYFLEMTSYLRQYVPKYADRVENIAKLVRNKDVFRWEEEQEAAFKDLKVCS